jgi:hypothetical protein
MGSSVRLQRDEGVMLHVIGFFLLVFLAGCLAYWGWLD